MMSRELKLDEVPDFEIYLSNLERLKQVDLKKFNQVEIKETILKYAVLLPPMPSLILKPSEFNQSEFYRVRKNIDTTKENVKQLKPFTYPDIEHCNENGRANLKGKNVFYCSEELGTSLIESKPDPTDVYYIGIWQANTTRDVNAVTFIRKVKHSINGEIKEKELMRPLSPQISANGVDKSQQLQHFLYLIGDYYKTENKPYPFSSFFSDYLIYIRKFDCILYQSSEVNLFCNFAFHPAFVDDSFLKLKRVIKLDTISLSSTHLSYSVREIGVFERGEIKWRQLTNEEKTEFHSLIKKTEAMLPYLI